MKSLRKSLKRSLALVSALVMLVTVINVGWVLPVVAETTETSSYGEVVSHNVAGISEAEQAVLQSGMLSGGSFTYRAPAEDNSDGLIQVDADQKTIVAAAYTDSEQNVWEPVEVRIVDDTGVQETPTLVDHTASFTYSGNAYSVEADYQLAVAADEALERQLLNSPYWLAKGIDNLETLADSDVTSALNTLSSSDNFVDLLKSFAYGVKWNDSTLTFPESSENAEALYLQLTQNEGGKFDLELLMDAYAASSSKVGFLLSEGSNVQASAAETYTDLLAVYTQLSNSSTQQLITLFTSVTSGEINTALGVIKTLLNDIRPAAEDPWTVVGKTLLQSDLTVAQYRELDTLLAAVDVEALAPADGQTGPYDEATLPTTLIVAETTVTYNLNRYTVTVQVAAQVVDSTTLNSSALTDLETRTTVVTLDEGSTGEQIRQAVEASGVEAQALSAWNAFYGINETNYTRTVTPDTTVSGYELTEDITYQIVYTPKELTVNYGSGFTSAEATPVAVPYGYQLLLPAYAGEQVYDYTVNGADQDQGTVIRLTENTTISRVLGKVWEKHSLGTLIANNYAADDAAATAILESAALQTGSFRLRTPTADDALVNIQVTDDGYLLTADTYKANTGDLRWVPVQATLVGGAYEGQTWAMTASGNTYTATIPFDYDFEQVTVQYQVSLAWDVLGETEEQVLATLNLPYTLTQEAAQQLAALNVLASQYSNLGTVNENLNAIVTAVNGSEDLPAESKAAMKDVSDNGKNPTTRDLYLYEYIGEYRALKTDAERLAFYYQNYAGETGIKAQMDRLYNDFTIVAVDNRDSFEAFLLAMDDGVAGKYSSYLERIDDIVARLETVENNLVAPNAAINLNSTGLTTLATLVANNQGKTQAYTGSLAVPVLETELSVDAPNKLSVTVNVQVNSSDGDVLAKATDSRSFALDGSSVTLNKSNIAELTTLMEELKQTAGLDEAHYVLASGSLPEENTVLTSALNVTLVWVPRTYTVNFVDEQGAALGSATFPYDAATVVLAASEETGTRFDYAIDGAAVNTDKYTFTSAQLDRLFVNGVYTIQRETVDVYRENLLALVDSLNQSIEKAGFTLDQNGRTVLAAAFIPVEDANGQISVVLRVTPQTQGLGESLLSSIGQELLNSGFDYLGLNGEQLFADNTLYLQSLVDAILNSGLGTSTITSIISTSGDICELQLDGQVIGAVDGSIKVGSGSISQVNLLGGSLLATSLQVGDSATAGESVPFYITIEDFDKQASTLSSLRSAVANVSQYVEVTAANGSLNVELNLTDRQYQAALSAALVADQAQLSDVNALDSVQLMHYLFDMFAPLVNDPQVTASTLMNTLKELGVTVNLAGYDNISGILRNLLQNTTVSDESGEGDVYSATLLYDLTSVIDKAGLSSLAGVIAENKTGLSFPVNVTVDNLNKTYQAVVLDPKQSGTAKLYYYSDAASLQSALSNNASRSAVVLLDDLDGDLTVNHYGVVLDLNGHTITGNLTGNARVLVVDTSAAKSGKVNGTVSGSVSLTAGTYAADVSDFLPDGYSQTDGVVANDLYSWAQDEDGNYTLTLKAAILKLDTLPDVESMALNLACDLLLNHYTCASLSFDDYEIYNVTIEDVLALAGGDIDAAKANELLACFNADGVTGLANDLLTAITDLQSVSAALAQDGVVKTYTMTTAPWTVTPVYQADGDVITANIQPGETSTRTVSLKIEDNDDRDIAELVSKLAEVLTAEASVSLTQPTYANRVVATTMSGTAGAVFDLTQDTDYAAVLAVVLADQATGTTREALVKAVNTYLATGRTAAMKQAVESVTTAGLLQSLKKLERGGFADMAARVGINDASSLEALESAYDDLLVLVGKTISYLNFSGSNSALGAFAVEGEYGTYALSKSYTRSISRAVRGYSAQANVQANASLTIKLFKEDAEDAVVVTAADDTVLYQGDSLSEAFAAATAGSTIAINLPVQLDQNVTVASAVTVTGASKMDLGENTVALTDAAAALTADAALGTAVQSGVEHYLVSEIAADGTVTYSLTPIVYPVVVTANSETLYRGSDLNAAFAAAPAGGTITVNESVKLEQSVTVAVALTVVGADKIDQNGQTIDLASGGSLTSDAALTVTTQLAFNAVVRSESTYQLSPLAPSITSEVAVAAQSAISAGKVSNGYLLVDVDPEGVTDAQLIAALSIETENASDVSYRITGLYNGLVATGSKLTITASNTATTQTATKEYTLVVMGDTNGNGFIDAGDSAKMMSSWVNDEELPEAARLAADMNQNGEIDAGDAAMNMAKYAYLWDTGAYTSYLN